MSAVAETEAEIARVYTHDSIFARGYAAGYVTAMIHVRKPFELRVLATQLPSLRRLLRDATATVTVEPTIVRNDFGVEYVRIRARW